MKRSEQNVPPNLKWNDEMSSVFLNFNLKDGYVLNIIYFYQFKI